MSAEEIATTLRDCKSWQEASSHKRGAFAYEMKDRQYGWDALTQAWGWFLIGWQSCAELG